MILCPKCTEIHLRASIDFKNFPELYSDQRRNYIGANWNNCSGRAAQGHLCKSCKSDEKIFSLGGGGGRGRPGIVGSARLRLAGYTFSRQSGRFKL